MKPKITTIKTNFRGIELPKAPRRGKAFEDVLANLGSPVTQGEGPDYPDYDLEVKTKDTDSTSANSVGSMTWDNIRATPYPFSNISKKLQQQFRVKVKDDVIVDTKVYDFSAPYVQDVISTAYETARAKIIAGDKSNYIAGTKYGYFERKRSGSGKLTNSWAFRIPVGSMRKLENMAQSTFQQIFEHD